MKLDLTKPLVYLREGKEYQLTLESSTGQEDYGDVDQVDTKSDDVVFKAKYVIPSYGVNWGFVVYIKDDGHEYVKEKSGYVQKSLSPVVRNTKEDINSRSRL